MSFKTASKHSVLLKLGGFVVLLIFFLISIPGNKSEADDAFAYALLVDSGDAESIFAPRYLLFLPFFKLLSFIADQAGLNWSSYQVMVYFNCVCSALVLLIVYQVYTRVLQQRRIASIWGCLFLAFSYAYWRYSVEAEVYMLSNLLCISTLYMLLLPSANTARNVIIAALIAGVAILMYKPNAIPLFLSFGLPLLLKRRWKQLVIYYSIAGFVTILGYYLVYAWLQKEDGFISFFLDGSSKSYGSPFLTIFIMVTNVVASMFMYGIKPVQDMIAAKFPANMITEEVYATQQNLVFSQLALMSLVLLAITFLIVLLKRNRLGIRFNLTSVYGVLLLWVITYSLVLLYLDPNSPEPWTMLLLPLTMLFTNYVIYPFFIKKLYLFPFLLLGLLFLHNFLGGYIFIAKKDTDYSGFVADKAIEIAGENDLILSLGSRYTLSYIDYYSPAMICSPEQVFDACLEMAEATIRSGGKVYVLDDMINIDPVVKFRNPQSYEKVRLFAEKYKDHLLLVNENDMRCGKVYRLDYTGEIALPE